MASAASSSSSSASGTEDTGDAVGFPTAALPRSNRSSPAASRPSKGVFSSSGGTCGCRASGYPRTCYECLNTRLQSGEPCVVTPLGLCMSASQATTLQSLSNASFVFCTSSTNCTTVRHTNQYLWSSNETYCEASDEKCASCRAQWVNSFQNDLLQSIANLTCVGASGCICMAYCVLRVTSTVTLPAVYNMGGESCSASGSSSGGYTDSGATAASMNTIMNSIALVGGAIMLAFLIRRGVTYYRQREHELTLQARRRALRMQRNEAARPALMLTLDGWNSYRERLIGSEQENLGLKTEPTLTDEPSHAIVEEGEGFRPASPSQHAMPHASTHEA